MGFILKLVKWVVIGLVALTLVSIFLPAKQTVSRNRVIAATPDKIWPMLVDLKAWQKWSPWIEADPDMDIHYSGPPEGVGAKSAWQSKNSGNGNLEITATHPPRELVYKMQFDDRGTATGNFKLQPSEGGTNVIWSMESDAGANPVGRWFGLFLEKFVAPDFERGLALLGKLHPKK